MSSAPTPLMLKKSRSATVVESKECDSNFLNPARLAGWEAVAPGVWRIKLGQPELITPVSRRVSASKTDEAFLRLPSVGDAQPFATTEITFRNHSRGCTIGLPYNRDEGIYGLGLQLKSHLQSGKKKHLRVNADPCVDTGDSHAPVPFYVSTLGYAIYADTARYASFYFGTHASVDHVDQRVREKWGLDDKPKRDPSELYASYSIGDEAVIDIPAAQGVTLYYFAGPNMKSAVSRYVLFSGGGCMPPLWGLGNWYRACAEHKEQDVKDLIQSFQKKDLPFSVIGLEPGWHTHFYPNSFVWSPRFPDPKRFARELHDQGYRLNLWENAFVHPNAPFAKEIIPYCGDQTCTDGWAPDFLHREAKRIFAKHHDGLIEDGVDGFKLDECDNGDFLPFAWSFPEHTQFPSGADGEQMHALYGVHYQHTLADNFINRNQRHFDLVRSSGALAAPLSYVLYSDLYDHDDFIRGVVNSGFSGLLWTPEVRHAASPEDLVRRSQATALSAMCLINAWYIPRPPWEQVNRALNEKGVLMEESEEITNIIRDILKLRMRLLPYLYTAFARYSQIGTPPFRALVMDYPEDRRTWKCDRQFLIGSCLMAAPIMAGESSLDVYFPEGLWREFSTGKRVEGGRTVKFENLGLSDLLLFVKDGSILPLADPSYCFNGKSSMVVQPHVYAETIARGDLYEDDGLTYGYRQGASVWHHMKWSPEGGLNSEKILSGNQFAFKTFRVTGAVLMQG